jgi:hypothetical protein
MNRTVLQFLGHVESRRVSVMSILRHLDGMFLDHARPLLCLPLDLSPVTQKFTSVSVVLSCRCLRGMTACMLDTLNLEHQQFRDFSEK